MANFLYALYLTSCLLANFEYDAWYSNYIRNNNLPPHFNGFNREQKEGCMQPPIQNINGISI